MELVKTTDGKLHKLLMNNYELSTLNYIIKCLGCRELSMAENEFMRKYQKLNKQNMEKN